MNYNLSNFNTATRNTEIGLAESFTEEIKHSHRYIPEIKKWIVFQNSQWKFINEDEVNTSALEFFQKEAEYISQINDQEQRTSQIREFKRHAKSSTVNNIVRLASLMLKQSADEIDKDQFCLFWT